MRQFVYLTIKLVLLASLFLIFYSYAMFQGGFVSWFLFYCSLPFLLYELLFILYPIRNWTVKRAVQTRLIKAGQAVRIQIACKRRFPAPVPYLIIEDILPVSLYSRFDPKRWASLLVANQSPQREKTVMKMFYPLFKRNIVTEYELTKLPRGVHSFQQVTLSMTDLFGFVTKSVVLPVESTIHVAPANVELNVGLADNVREAGEEIASTMPTDRSSHIAGVRQYVPGDRLSSIHWKQSAKRDALMTKEFDQEYSRDGTLILLGVENGIAYEWNLAVCQAVLRAFEQLNHRIDFAHMGREYFSISIDQPRTISADTFIHFKAGADEKMITAGFDYYQRTFNKGNFLLVFTDRLTKEVAHELVKTSVDVFRITVYLTKATSEQRKEEQDLIDKIKSDRIRVNVITEEDLKKVTRVVTI